MILDHMIQDHDLGAKFHRRNPRLAISRENVGAVILAETTNDLVTGVVAIPSVIFFPDDVTHEGFPKFQSPDGCQKTT